LPKFFKFADKLIDPVCWWARDGAVFVMARAVWLHSANLQLQVDQLILGPSQRSAQERAGSHRRLRFSFISRYHRGIQGYPV